MLLSLYKTKCKTKKWYHRIFFHLLSLSVVNAWTIYREIGGNSSLLDFQMNVSKCLINNVSTSDDENIEPLAKRRSAVKASQVPHEIRYDQKNHWPIQLDGTTQRCKNPGCNRRGRFICSKCQIVLCVVGSKCFTQFHGV